MRYILARYMKDGAPHGRAYTFKVDFDTKPGDIVVANGKEVVVSDGEADIDFVKTYGEDRIVAVEQKEVENG